MMKILRPLALTVFALLATLSFQPATWAQDQPAQAASESEEGDPKDTDLQEEVTVRLVQMPFLAQDRKGNPITDLTADDIIVKDRGKQMRIAYVEPQLKRYTVEEELPLVRLYVQLPGVAAPSKTLETPPRRLIFYVDIENDQKLNKPDAVRDMTRYLEENFDGNTLAAVMAYTGEVETLVGFTNNKQEVIQGIREAFALGARPNITLKARIRQLVDQMRECSREFGAAVGVGDEICITNAAEEYMEQMRPFAQDYLRGLEAVVRFLGGVPGRKTVVALSHGSPSDPSVEAIEAARAIYGNTDQMSSLRISLQTLPNARLDLTQLVDLAVERRVSLNFVDRNSAPSGDVDASQGYTYQPGAFPMQTAFTAVQMELEEMAKNTGGVFIHSANDLYRGVKYVEKLQQGAYELGYYVDHPSQIKRMNKVRIDTKRKGVRITHSRGYYRRPKGSTLEAMGEIKVTGMRPSSQSDGQEGEFHFAPFKVEVDPYRLGYEVGKGAAGADLTFHVRIDDEDGRTLTDVYTFTAHSYPLDVFRAGNAEPLMFEGWAELPPGLFRIVATVGNPKSGHSGEFVKTVEIKKKPTS